MEIRHYLALTAAEFLSVSEFPVHCAWMACHFSPYGTGLSNLPESLPAGAALMLNDRIPFCGHDPERIADQLSRTADALGFSALLLDFHQENIPELKELCGYLAHALPCSTVVADTYAADLDCPVFLRPCPHHLLLEEHIAPWKNRELWLDLAVNGECICLTEAGAVICPMPMGEIPETGFADPHTHCHYAIETGPDSARFRLWRTAEDLQELKEAAIALGITHFAGLYQEMYPVRNK